MLKVGIVYNYTSLWKNNIRSDNIIVKPIKRLKNSSSETALSKSIYQLEKSIWIFLAYHNNIWCRHLSVMLLGLCRMKSYMNCNKYHVSLQYLHNTSVFNIYLNEGWCIQETYNNYAILIFWTKDTFFYNSSVF